LKNADTPSSITAKDPNSESEDSSLTTIYRIGIGDVLDIRVRNFASGASTLFTVTEGGTIDYPILGAPFPAVGQTTDELQKRLVFEFKRRALLESPQVSVTVRQYTSHTVMITGLVASGGTKLLRREAVPLYVILAEAQSRLEAARANIMRLNQPVITVDLTDPTSLGVLVRPGDIIAITARPELYYYIAGRINSAGQKSFQPGITLLQSILAAGGLRNQTDASVEISREGGNGNLVTTRYTVSQIKSGKTPDPRLQPGDRIEVRK
jgi:protein involved in polysaccharide export with SLBB domain